MNQDLLRGASFVLLGELLLAVMSAAIKAAAVELPAEMLVFFRNLFGLLLLLPLIIGRSGSVSMRTDKLHLHILRGVAGVAAMYCFFYTIVHLALAEAIVLKLTMPFFIPLIALFWLRESIPASARWAIVIGFLGVLLILRPGFEQVSTVALVGILGAALAALAKVTIRRMTATEPSTRIVFYFGVTASLVSAVPLLWAWQTPSLGAFGWLLLMGGSATCAQLLLTRAYALAPAGQIGPFSYASVVYGSLLGWLFWGELMGLLTVAGAALIVGAGILTLRRSRRPAPQPAAPTVAAR